MEALGYILIAVIVFMFGWNQIGASDSRTTSIITGAASILMAAAVVFQGATIFGTAATAPIGALLLLWAVYGAMVSAMGVFDVGGRAVGFYALFLALAMAAYAIFFVTNGVISGFIVSVAVGIPFLIQFFQFIVPYRGLAPLTGWLLLLAGIVSGAAGLGVIMNVIA